VEEDHNQYLRKNLCGGRSQSVFEEELSVRASLHPIPMCKFFGKAYCHVSVGIPWNSRVRFSSFSGLFLSHAQCLSNRKITCISQDAQTPR
jgi:hypothetical protein